jgi:KipI family sensor histidine kinase inhibitor
MIYESPIYRPLGDRYLAVEFGDEANLALSFRVLALREVLADSNVPGILETQPTMRTLAILLDRRRTSHDSMKEAVEDALPAASRLRRLRSRVVELPVWYGDPWTVATARRYQAPDNLEFVADHNGISVADVVERHTSSQHWSTVIGFHPGSCVHYPLDPAKAVTAPKYKRPRDFTPARSVGLAGQATATYVFASPGGYQLLGRLAVDTFQEEPNNPAFPPDGVLLRAGDRIKYRSIDPFEYEEIREDLRAGRYEYVIEEGFCEADDQGRPRPALGDSSSDPRGSASDQTGE